MYSVLEALIPQLLFPKLGEGEPEVSLPILGKGCKGF